MAATANPLLPVLASKRSLAAFPLGGSSALLPALPAASPLAPYVPVAPYVPLAPFASAAAVPSPASEAVLLGLPPAHTSYLPPPELLWDSATRPRRHHPQLPSHLAHPRCAVGDVFRAYRLLPLPPQEPPPAVLARRQAAGRASADTPRRSGGGLTTPGRPSSSGSPDPMRGYREAITSLSRAQTRAYAEGSPLAEAVARYGMPTNLLGALDSSEGGGEEDGEDGSGGSPGGFGGGGAVGPFGAAPVVPPGSGRKLRISLSSRLPWTTLSFLLLCLAGLTWSILASGGLADSGLNPLFGPTPAALVGTGGRLGYYLVKPRSLIAAAAATKPPAASATPSPSVSALPSGTVRPTPSATPTRHPTPSPTASVTSSPSLSPAPPSPGGASGGAILPLLNGTAVNATASRLPAPPLTGLQLPTQWWRIITPVWLHAGLVHLAVNGLLAWRVCLPVERFLGPLRMAGLFAATALFGCSISYVFTPVSYVGGHASVPLMGAAGVAVASIVRRHMARLPLSGRFEDEDSIIGPDGELIRPSWLQRLKTAFLELFCLSSTARKRRSKARQSRRSARLSGSGAPSPGGSSVGSATRPSTAVLGAAVGPLEVVVACLPALVVSCAPMVDLWASLGGLVGGFLLGLSELNAAPDDKPSKLRKALQRCCTRTRVKLFGYSEKDHDAAVRASVREGASSPGNRRSLARRPAFAAGSSRSIPRREGLCSFLAVYGGLAAFFICFALAFLAIVQDVSLPAAGCSACAKVSCAPLGAWVCEPAAGPWIPPPEELGGGSSSSSGTGGGASTGGTSTGPDPIPSPDPLPSPSPAGVGGGRRRLAQRGYYV